MINTTVEVKKSKEFNIKLNKQEHKKGRKFKRV